MILRAVNRRMERAARAQDAFTLIELLVVIALIIALAALAIPSFKGLTGSNVTGGALQQLVDDLSEARLRAMNGRGTVYVVFAPPVNQLPMNQLRALPPAQKRQLTNAVKGQYSAYIMFTKRNLGDQPGAENPRFLSEWKFLPQGIFIATNKFLRLTQNSWENWPTTGVNQNSTNRPFFYMNLPFPTATNAPVALPAIAFDYRGRLLSAPFSSEAPFRKDPEYIQITQGTLIVDKDVNSGETLLAQAEVLEAPRGNTTENPVIMIDPLTGRPRVLPLKGEKP